MGYHIQYIPLIRRGSGPSRNRVITRIALYAVLGGGGHDAAAVSVDGAVMVFVLKSSKRGIRGWFYFFSTTLGSS